MPVFFALTLAMLLALAHFASVNRAPVSVEFVDAQVATVDRSSPIESPRDCMALAAFTEARSEGAAGMAAVIAVIRNRAADARYPADACAIVRQAGQFIGLGDWTPARAERVNPLAWASALALADVAESGADLVPPRCRGATSFNRAIGSRGLSARCRIGSHTFYTEASP